MLLVFFSEHINKLVSKCISQLIIGKVEVSWVQGDK